MLFSADDRVGAHSTSTVAGAAAVAGSGASWFGLLERAKAGGRSKVRKPAKVKGTDALALSRRRATPTR